MTNRKNGFFIVPHILEECLVDQLLPSEKYFLIILIKLENRFTIAGSGNWFFHKDRLFSYRSGESGGFKKYGFSESTSKRIRRKLRSLGFIEIRYQTNINNNSQLTGTEYRIIWNRLLNGMPFPEVQNEPP